MESKEVQCAQREEYKMTKIKSAIKLYSNEDSTMSLVRAFEDNAALSRSSVARQRG